MFSLRLASYLIVAPVLSGAFVIAFLTLDMVSATNIAIGAIAGAIIGIPAAWMLANKIDGLIKPKKG